MKNWLEEVSNTPIKDINSGVTYLLSDTPIFLFIKIFDTVAWDTIER